MSEVKGEYLVAVPVAVGKVHHCAHCKEPLGLVVEFCGRHMVDLGTVLVDWAPRMVCKSCWGKIHYSAADCLIREK